MPADSAVAEEALDYEGVMLASPTGFEPNQDSFRNRLMTHDFRL